MQVHRNLKQLPTFTNAIVTIGTFDGVHVGHQKIIDLLNEEARLVNGETVIITFDPHPRSVVKHLDSAVPLITTLDEKIALLEKAGITHLVIVPFDEAFANQTPEAYVASFLYHYFRPHTIVIGYDHRFGKNRAGDYHLLERMGKELGFVVKEIPEAVLNEIIVSSTQIRNALHGHQIELANAFLGYPFFFAGKVVLGNQLGRTIGFPTANMQMLHEQKLIPANGVYAVAVYWKEGLTKQRFWGMMNIGVRPTINGHDRVIEVHIFEFDDTIYGQELQIQVHAFLRSEQKFAGIAALKEQLFLDAELAKKTLQQLNIPA